MADELSDRIARLEGRLPEFDKRMEDRFSAMGVAIDKASAALEKRLDNVNEWRQSYDDLTRQKVGKDEAATRFYMTIGLSVLALLVSIAAVAVRLGGR